MNELIKISQQVIGKNEINSVNARELHEFLESKQDFSNWIKRRIENYNFKENQDFITLNKKVERQILIEYFLTIDMAKEISMVEINEKGKQARQYFIECERKLKEKEKPKTTAEQLLAQAQYLVDMENRLSQLPLDKSRGLNSDVQRKS